MSTEVERDRPAAGHSQEQETNTCPNCSNLMSREMRFCRACGCRLGEGVEEYTETVRLKSAPRTSKTRTNTAPAGKARTAANIPPLASGAGLRDWGAQARSVRTDALRKVSAMKVGRACKRVPRWVFWVFFPIFIVSLIGGSASHRRNRTVPPSSVTKNSYLGSHYKTANGGAFIQDITPPGSAADQAGLIGGDTIIRFDDKPVKSDDDLSKLLSATPAGKSVDVVYIRDGETRSTKVKTISEEENQDLEEAFDERSEGQGKLGLDDDADARVVSVPGTNISGVKLGSLAENLPADMAGVREGDVVIQFDKTPIRTVEELVSRIHRATPYRTVNLTVMRGAERLDIPVKMGKQ